LIEVTAYMSLGSVKLTPLAPGENDGSEEHKDAGTLTLELSKGLANEDLHTLMANVPHLQRRACRMKVNAGRAGEWAGHARVGGANVKPPKEDGGISRITMQVRVADDQPNLHSLMSILLQHLDFGGGTLTVEFQQYDEEKLPSETPPLPFGEPAQVGAQLILQNAGGLVTISGEDPAAAFAAVAVHLRENPVIKFGPDADLAQPTYTQDCGLYFLPGTDVPPVTWQRVLNALRSVQLVSPLPEKLVDEEYQQASAVLSNVSAIIRTIEEAHAGELHTADVPAGWDVKPPDEPSAQDRALGDAHDQEGDGAEAE